MSSLETVIGVLERHREARHWADLDVARDVLAALGIPLESAEAQPVPTVVEVPSEAPVIV